MHSCCDGDSGGVWECYVGEGWVRLYQKELTDKNVRKHSLKTYTDFSLAVYKFITNLFVPSLSVTVNMSISLSASWL